MKFLSRSWRLSAFEVSKALAPPQVLPKSLFSAAPSYIESGSGTILCLATGIITIFSKKKKKHTRLNSNSHQGCKMELNSANILNWIYNS
ncbi:hypothetical protein RDI58_021864 [Solanum bulbocastanum]|uniref:VAN3-binding protein-like auxin canalisation domain-containing protein n=1 Tax=Solanum bulbocastanum TaxID=147425 RepID=A0AAN8Y4Q5_SOLBU